MSRECRFRIVSSLSASSKLLPDEIKKIRGLRAAIDAVGRNIRHMMFQSKKLDMNDTAFLKEIETLNSYMAMAIKKIDELQEVSVDGVRGAMEQPTDLRIMASGSIPVIPYAD
ncbi:hypothetical protein ALP23_200012 [Pseudomonas syringae pv. apii]|uniref:Uncharacterized protein n=1 Tax=Pseudomonas syringae pv. apii TaxID=81036 RepID=A0A3M5WJ21_9PSED|nr:hypothetical protein ALP23_200012 [Pseudomonas syringae pv. apii]